MIAPLSSRRTFLRSLASLPLIGGGLTLIGNPTAAAVPVTPALQNRYIAWLANEHAAALAEHERSLNYQQEVVEGSPETWAFYRVRTPLFWFPDAPDIERSVTTTRPSTRAAVVLSAAGVGLD